MIGDVCLGSVPLPAPLSDLNGHMRPLMRSVYEWILNAQAPEVEHPRTHQPDRGGG